MRPSPHVHPHLYRVSALVKFQGYEFGWGFGNVGEGTGVAAGEPVDLSGHEVAKIGRVNVVEVMLL